MDTLAQIYERHRTVGDVGHGDKGSTHSYIPVYEKILARYRNGCTLMEVGIARGLSLEMWREYMPTSTIIGVDLSIAFDPESHIKSGTVLIVSDATKPEFREKIKQYRFDVVIDDASHVMDDQMATFNTVKPFMNPGGIYIIEDVLAMDTERKRLRYAHPRCNIHDLRRIKGLFCDVLVTYQF